MKFKSYLIFYLFVYSLGGFSQTPKEELSEIAKKYNSFNEFSADVSAVTYSTQLDVTGTLFGDGLFVKIGTALHTKFKFEECIKNDNCIVVIDHKTKQISYRKTKYLTKTNSMAGMPSVDEVLTKCDSVRKKVITGSQYIYSVYLKGIVKHTDVIVDKDKLIQKITYFFDQSNTKQRFPYYKLEMIYANIKTSSVDPNLIKEDKIIQYKAGKPILSEDYGQYKLMVLQPQRTSLKR